MNNQSQNQNFYVVPIPQNITVLQSFKKWRRTGENLNGAIMIGVLEHFLINGWLEKLQQMLNNVKSVSDDQVKKMKNCIEQSLQFQKGEQKLDFIMDYLKQYDPHNIFAEKFILEYVKRVKGNIKSDDELLKTSKSLFSVSITIIGNDNQNNLNTILDPKERDVIILYNYNSKYYVIQKEAGPQLYKCLFCTKQISEDYYKMNCSQIICYQCLKRFFDKGNKQIQCKEKNCTSTITLSDYQKIMNKKKENEKTEQLNQIIKQKAEEKQQFQLSSCNKCKNRMSLEVLLQPQGCSHNFCKDCLILCFSVVPSGYYQCVIQGCKGKFIQKDFDQFTKGNNSGKQNFQTQTSQNKSSNLALSTTPQENQEINNQCEGCFNYFSLSSIYTAQCSHKYCQICCDKEIKKNISCFQCYKVNCGYKLRIDEIQKFYYKKIKSLTFGECANCKHECKIFESFQNKCQHLICYICVKQIYNEGLTPICKLCQTVIDPNELDEFYLPQASKEIQEIDPIEYSLEQLTCTFCNSPFTNYNLQQDIPCQIHHLGTCCVIFPSDCPQCQIGSLIIEKQKLRFVLFQNEMDSFNFTTKSSIK